MHKDNPDSTVPNDRDGDGIPDYIDKDADGDGILDKLEKDTDGDGIPDFKDKDIDNDGIANEKDIDANGDGRPDDEEDDDGDGILNNVDLDRDGNGIMDHLEVGFKGFEGSKNSVGSHKGQICKTFHIGLHHTKRYEEDIFKKRGSRFHLTPMLDGHSYKMLYIPYIER